MAVKDYLALNDFRDQEGEITYDDAANTFRGSISDLSRLGRVRIVVKKGNTPYSDNTYYAILDTRDENLIDYNTIRNSIVSSGNFNSICKSWANKIIDRANNVNVIYYEYKLPDPPPPAEGGVKFLRKEAYFESVDLGHGARIGISQNPTYTENIINRRVLFSASRFNGNRHNTLITMRHDVSNLDIRNGDELRFIYGYAYRLPSWLHVERGNAIGDLDTFNHERLQLWIDSVLCKQELISQ